MMQKYTSYIIALICTIAVSCSDNSSNEAVTADSIGDMLEKEIELDSILVEKGVVQKLDLVIENLVLSDKIVEVISRDSSLFSADLLHNPNDAGKYVASKEKAVVLGVYGADMNYVLHYEQTQQSFKYLLVSKSLAENIGVAMAFDQKTMQNYQDNSSHKDSLITIVHTAYANVKKHLKNSDQFLMSSLVIAGTWIENMYLATSHYDMTTDNELKKDLGKRILGQGDYLNSVIVLLEDLAPENDEYVDGLISKFESVKSVYANSSGTGDPILMLRDEIKSIRDTLLLN